eukprot:scaffold208251_cov30-Tisochrysis_lutea.AAC.7
MTSVRPSRRSTKGALRCAACLQGSSTSSLRTLAERTLSGRPSCARAAGESTTWLSRSVPDWSWMSWLEVKEPSRR